MTYVRANLTESQCFCFVSPYTHFRFTKRVQLVVGFRNQKKNRSSVFLELVPKSDPLGTIVLGSGFSRFQRFTGSYFGIGTKT